MIISSSSNKEVLSATACQIIVPGPSKQHIVAFVAVKVVAIGAAEGEVILLRSGPDTGVRQTDALHCGNHRIPSHGIVGPCLQVPEPIPFGERLTGVVPKIDEVLHCVAGINILSCIEAGVHRAEIEHYPVVGNLERNVVKVGLQACLHHKRAIYGFAQGVVGTVQKSFALGEEIDCE